MDPVTALGVATGVIGLIPLCAQGFNMVTACFNAKNEYKESMTKITVQSILFINWGKPMGLEDVSDQIAVDALKRRIPNWDYIGPGVLKILAAMSDTFADIKTLQDTYGLEPSEASNELAQLKFEKDDSLKRPDIWKYMLKLKKRKNHMNVLQRVKFTLGDKDKFAALADILYHYNFGLINVCPPVLVQTIYNIMLPEMLSSDDGQKDPGNVAKVARKLAESNPSAIDKGQRAGYDLLASAASFRAKVKDAQAENFVPLSGDHITRPSNWAIKDGKNNLGTMAYRQSGSNPSDVRLYYIEWKSYRSHRDKVIFNIELEKEIQSLAKVARIADKPTEFLVLDCLGAFKDAQNTRYGFLYPLPSYLFTIRKDDIKDEDVIRRRKPANLLSLMEATKDWVPLDLGSRIALARKLAQSLLVLHAGGWVHKNISSKSIIFFRDRSASSSGPSTTGRLDYDNPYICGFGQSRPDYSAVYQQRPRSAPQDLHPEPPLYLDKAQIQGVPHLRLPAKTSIPRPLQEQRQVMKNLYQHPAKRLDPNIYYQSSFDLYSLGCVLLEIALWQPLSKLTAGDGEDPHDFRNRLLSITKSEMPGLVGRIYAEATRRCLDINDGEREDQEQKKGLCWRLIEDLGKCVV